MAQGKFIVIEGSDGSGTTTQTPVAVNHIYNLDKSHVVITTREPTKLSLQGQEIRRRLTNSLLPNEVTIHDKEYWTNLFIKDRLWHLDNIVEPNLKQGLHVVSDRHMLSTLAYQFTQGKSMDELIALHQNMIKPDLTIYLQVSLKTTESRMSKDNKRQQEYFERHDFLNKVLTNYLTAIQKVGKEQNVVIIDGELPIKEVSKGIINEINRLYSKEPRAETRLIG